MRNSAPVFVAQPFLAVRRKPPPIPEESSLIATVPLESCPKDFHQRKTSTGRNACATKARQSQTVPLESCPHDLPAKRTLTGIPKANPSLSLGGCTALCPPPWSREFAQPRMTVPQTPQRPIQKNLLAGYSANLMPRWIQLAPAPSGWPTPSSPPTPSIPSFAAPSLAATSCMLTWSCPTTSMSCLTLTCLSPKSPESSKELRPAISMAA